MQKVRVASINRETPEIVSLDLVAIEGEKLPTAPPGSHIDVQIGEAPGALMLRQYSLCQAPNEVSLYRIGIKRELESRGGSRWLHESVREGDVLQVGTPKDSFAPSPDAAMHVLVAGGIGVTPLLSIALHLHSLGRPFRLEYFVRSMDHAAFASLLLQPGVRDHVRFHIGVGPGKLRSVVEDCIGHPSKDTHIYVCGPAPFMAVVEEVASFSWPFDSIHREYFGAVAAQREGDTAFTIRLAHRGKDLVVPGDQSILSVLEQEGITVDSSCRQGACGSCLVSVLEGSPDHRDNFLLPDEQAQGKCVITCVSRSFSPVLVLDL